MPTNSLHPNSHHAARRPRRRRLLALGLAASLTALGALIPAAAGAAPQATPAAQAFQAAGDLTHEEHLLLEGLDVDYILSHLAYIEDNIGPGIGGSPAERHRAEYLGGQLQALGYEPWTFATGQDGTDDYIQEFSDTSVAATIVGSVTLNGREYAANGPAYNANGVYKGFNTPEVTGQTVYYPTLADATAAPAADVAGKIVLTIRGAGTAGRTEYAAGAATLEANGAIALVAIHPKYTVAATGKVSAETAFSAVTSGTQVNIPVVLTSYLDGKAILAALDDGAGNIQSGTLTVRNARGDKSVNVLAFKPAAEPTNRTVIIGGHLDSKIGTTGANDNLSGPAVILGIAKALQDVPTKYNIVFAFWGSEELGLRGSRAFYSSTLAPDAYWKNIIAYYNLDMAATSQLTNAYLTQHTAYRDTSTSPATALRSWAGDTVAVQADRYWDYANANGELATWWKKEYIDPATGNVTALGLEYYGSCSDHASISGANAGVVYESSVPAVYTFWRDAGVNTGAGAVVEYNYHVVGDRYIWPADEDQFSLQGETELYQGNISPERAKILGSVYLLTLARVAGGPVYPQALDLTAAGTPGRVTATWEAPDDGGSAITGYSLRLVPSSGTAVTVQVAASATSYTFEGVAAGTYTVKASATNAIGTSPVVTSAAVDVAPATAPAAPA
ncbi:MAG: M28 family metallopeptidase, partial [Bifidobacteriaceae bacterium]|nr:M28 family metallopeptidase [Bifidobacteriaceae bacterium]